MFTLCGIYMRYRQRGVQAELDRLAGALTLAVATVAAAVWASVDPWRAEPVWLILFGMTMAIAYRSELALLFSGVVSWIIVLAMGENLPMYLLMFGTTAAAALNLGRIRTRSKLIYVGLFAGCVAALLDLAMNLIDNQPLGLALLLGAGWQFVWATLAGCFMTTLLPFVERLFGVLTDLSLLELGDITHPVLQELVRRAPSTYNHSITVGSIAEAAAETIGARGLLCRVGAYFHDIGKMLKPGYFVENQGKEGSRHEGLVPAMSTLVIIAHIKDGADLARQHHLPQPIIDMIQQHHGTMLMEYFYDRATRSRPPIPTAARSTRTCSATPARSHRPRRPPCSCWPTLWRAPAGPWSIPRPAASKASSATSRSGVCRGGNSTKAASRCTNWAPSNAALRCRWPRSTMDGSSIPINAPPKRKFEIRSRKYETNQKFKREKSKTAQATDETRTEHGFCLRVPSVFLPWPSI